MHNLKRLSFLGLILLHYSLFGQIKVSADRSDATYKAGEAMNFHVEGGFGTATYKIHYDQGFTPAIASGTVQLNGGTTQIPFRTDEPSVVICTVTNNGQSDLAGAAFSPFDIQPYEDDPADFDDFWKKQKNLLAAVPIAPVMTSLPSSNRRTRDYRINLGQIDGRRVYGYLSIPDKPGSFPAIITHAAFGAGANICMPRPEIATELDAISVSIWMHNTEPDLHDANAYLPGITDDPEQIYYRYGVLGIIRAIDFVYTLPEFRGEGIGLNGISEGGGMSLLAAGVDSRVTAVAASIFAHSEHSGFKYGRASGFPYYLHKSTPTMTDKVLAASKYYDALRSAKRFDGPVLASVGYEDLVSIPATNFGAYNQLKGSSVLIHQVDEGHTNPDEFYHGKFRFFRKHLNLSGETDRTANAGFDQTTDGSDVFLSGIIEKNGLNNFSLPVEWKLISGPGQVRFSNPNERNTIADFSEDGEYILRFSATDRSLLSSEKIFFTIADHIKITVQNTPNPVIDEDNDGVPADIDCDDQEPSIGAVGSNCDDQDPTTENDVLRADCICAGSPIQPVDEDGDGVTADTDCDDQNPNIGAVGSTCDDQDPATENDLLQADCTCAGTPIQPPTNVCKTEFSLDGLELTIAPLEDPISLVKVFDTDFNILMDCNAWTDVCSDSESFRLPSPGTYYVQILTNAGWENEICNIFEKIVAEYNDCENVTDGGRISGEETVCPDEKPSAIMSDILPSGGNRPVEYLWLSSDRGCPTLLTDSISGARRSILELDQLSKTTYFRRLSKTVNCDDWFAGESNCIVKTLDTDCSTPPGSCDAEYFIDGNNVTITGLGKPITTVKIINKFTYAEIFSCNNFSTVCPDSLTVDLLPGKYFLQIITGRSWGEDYICYIFDEIEIQNAQNRQSFFSESTVRKDFSNFAVNKNNSDNVLIFPNPTNDFIYISSDLLPEKTGRVELINSQGKIELTAVFHPETNSESPIFDTRRLSAGVYFVRIIEAEKNIVTKKVFIR